jgi:hypothetical protein
MTYNLTYLSLKKMWVMTSVETVGYGLSAFGLRNIKSLSSCGLLLAPLVPQKVVRRFNEGIQWRLKISPVRDGRETISNFFHPVDF